MAGLPEIRAMESFNGWYQEWSGAEKQPVSLMLLEGYLQIGFIGRDQRIRWKYSDALATLSYDAAQTEIRHAEQPGRLELPGRLAYDRLLVRQQVSVEPWHKRPRQREWLRNGSLLVALVAMILLGYNLVVPFLSEKLASTVSVERERQLGDGVYDVLAIDYKIDTAKSRLVTDFFEAMKVPSAYALRFAVVESNELNAFALPGGRIVVYSALLDSMRSSAALAALLAHEFTHVNEKHSTRSIFRQLGSQVFVGLIFGKIGSVGAVLAEHANQLRSLTYSRSLEQEADLKGLALLMERGIDPVGFEELFSRLKNVHSVEMPEFLASHPDLDNRIRYIKESSKQAKTKHQPRLDSIFAQLK